MSHGMSLSQSQIFQSQLFGTCIWTQDTLRGLEAGTLLHLLKASAFGEQQDWMDNREAAESNASINVAAGFIFPVPRHSLFISCPPAKSPESQNFPFSLDAILHKQEAGPIQI